MRIRQRCDWTGKEGGGLEKKEGSWCVLGAA